MASMRIVEGMAASAVRPAFSVWLVHHCAELNEAFAAAGLPRIDLRG
jgi:hypothetical protein